MKAHIPCPQDGWTPLNSAASNGHEAVVRLLLDSKAAVDTANNVSGSEVSWHHSTIRLALSRLGGGAGEEAYARAIGTKHV